MTRHCLFFALFVVCPAFALDPEPAFDGKSLDGWQAQSGLWTAKNGSIVGVSDGKLKSNTFLCTKEKFKDFELSLQVKLTSAKTGEANTANSGVQIRSEVIDPKSWIVKGPQCDMGAKYWGSLYGEQFGGMMKQSDFDKLKPTFHFDDFNDYFIRVVGKHVAIKVNGITTVDGDFEKMPADGIIAFQLHQGPAMRVEFKNIRFKQLN